jgi:lysophospholipase L1-like esterase
MRTVTALALALCVSLLGGCGDAELQPLPAGSRILAFGDSLTEGVGVRPADSYPAVLSELSGLEVVNAGVSGETTVEGLARLERELERVQPQLLILLEGGNDILRNLGSRQTKANLAQMIAMAQDRSVPVLLLGVPEKNLFSSVAPLYDELAKEHAVLYERELIGDLMRTPRLKSDAVHFNERGYRRLAERLRARLRDSGAI